MSAGPTCGDERRRALARAAERNGIASITVDESQTRVSVLLLGKAPPGVGPEHVRIDEEPGARPVTVVAVEPCTDPDPEDSDCLLVRVDRPGDWSCYTLRLVADDEQGRPGTTPYPGFDQRLSSLSFTFKEHCPHPLDCACGCGDGAPPTSAPGPVVDQTARDYAALRQQLLDRLSLTLPGWTERHQADLGVTLVELLAYAGDLLHQRLDAVGTEAYLDTARLRTSVRRHARLVDYRMHDGAAARAFVCLDADEDVSLPAGTFRFRAGDEVFEPLLAEDVAVVAGHARIALWTWGDAECCLPAGTTEAVLADAGLRLAAGDLLLLEEVLGPVTGLAADADPGHRQVVRLVAVEHEHDDLLDQPLVRVRWADADALTFPLCVSARGGPECKDLQVGVARGNVLVVGHGASLTWCQAPPEVLDWPGPGPTERGCPDPSCAGCRPEGPVDRPAYPPRRRRPRLRPARWPVTQQTPWPQPAAVAAAQADVLGRLPGDVRRRLTGLLGADPLAEADLAWLETVFGSETLGRLDVRDHPATGIPALRSGLDRLLEVKLARLDRLRRRARSGSVLRQDVEGRELAWAWGVDHVVDPSSPALRGPAAAVCAVDPREALPAVELASDDGTVWSPERDLLSAGPSDPVFVGEVDDEGALWLRFGDGRQGREPDAGARLVAAYKVGNGSAGNVGPEAIATLEPCGLDAGVIRVRNPLPACGGVDPEPVAQVRQRAPREAATVLARAVTADDYARVAEREPGVQRAAAQLRWTGAWYEAQVAVDALGTGVPAPDLLAAESERLHRVRRIGHDVVVGPAREVSLVLSLCVRVDPAYLTGHVRGAVLALLGAGDGPGGTALFAPDRVTFGQPVRLSAVVAAVSAVPGVAGVTVSRLARQFGPDDGAALRDGVLELGGLEVARLDDDASRPDHGLVALVIGGGR